MKSVLHGKGFSSPTLLRGWIRGLLILIVLLAFARLVWRLDAKSLWWDESLSLQRAESDLPSLLTGRIVFSDGRDEVVTVDQHPFAYFALLGAFLRLAGESEFSLRFPSVMAGTLLVPALWAFARRLSRLGVVPPSSAVWAALFAAASPFYLWFGQETRPYAVWAFLALLSTYLLLRWATTDSPRSRRAYLAASIPVLIAFLSSHYFSAFLLPVQALIAYRGFRAQSHRLALGVAGSLVCVGLLAGAIPAWLILQQPGAGTNFAAISPEILLPDLNNAFSLGLSVDIEQVRWLDLVFALVALAGLGWALRSRRVALGWGWLLPALVLVPIAVLLAANLFRPLYMTARHMSLISGPYLVLVAAGLGLLWDRRRWLGGAVAVILLAGMAYSTCNYHTLPKYGKDDLAGLGRYIRSQLQPGDFLLLTPTEGLRLMRYYLPLDAVESAAAAGQGTGWAAVPPLQGGEAELGRMLERLGTQHRRIWLVKSGVPAGASPKPVDNWLGDHAFRVRDVPFRTAGADVRALLYLPSVPVHDTLPDAIQYRLDVAFDDQISLLGYDLGRPLFSGGAIPVTLYWQAAQPLARRYKYILRLEEVGPDGTNRPIHTTEREPYDGSLPTIAWPPRRTVVEYSEVEVPADVNLAAGRHRLTLQVYDAETLAKLPITASSGGTMESDGQTLVLRDSF